VLRPFTILAGVFLAVAVGLTAWKWISLSATSAVPELLMETMNFNTISSPELAKKAEDTFQRAHTAMRERLATGRTWRSCAAWLEGASLLIGAVLTVIGGWFGKPVSAGEGSSAGPEQLGRITARSKGHIRVLACGLAAVVALHSISDRCETLALQSVARGMTLADRIRQGRVEFDKAGNDAERDAALVALDAESLR
jgi:hypothetical protein